MAGADRSGGAESGRLRAVRGGAPRRATTAPPSPTDFGERLAALERQVEDAFAASDATASRLPDIGAAADDALVAYAGLRRWLAEASVSGITPAATVEAALLGLQRWWWRVEALGLERVPAQGAALVIVNRGSLLLPWDQLAVATALATLHPARRDAVTLVDDWAATYPILGTLLAAARCVPCTPSRLRLVLEDGGVAVTTLTGAEACGRPFAGRYRVARPSRLALLRTAIATGTPIIPIAVIGAEESHPVLARVDLVGRSLGLPSLPLTPTFPWLGLGGLVPLPTKWTLRVGEPLDVASWHRPEAARSSAAVAEVAGQVQERLQALVVEGLRRRRSVFFG